MCIKVTLVGVLAHLIQIMLWALLQVATLQVDTLINHYFRIVLRPNQENETAHQVPHFLLPTNRLEMERFCLLTHRLEMERIYLCLRPRLDLANSHIPIRSRTRSQQPSRSPMVLHTHQQPFQGLWNHLRRPRGWCRKIQKRMTNARPNFEEARLNLRRQVTLNFERAQTGQRWMYIIYSLYRGRILVHANFTSPCKYSSLPHLTPSRFYFRQ